MQRKIYKAVMKEYTNEAFTTALDSEDIPMLEASLITVIQDYDREYVRTPYDYYSQPVTTPFAACFPSKQSEIFKFLLHRERDDLAKLAIEQCPHLLASTCTAGTSCFLLALQKGFFKSIEKGVVSHASLPKFPFQFNADDFFQNLFLHHKNELTEIIQILLANPLPDLLAILNRNAEFNAAFTAAKLAHQEKHELKHENQSVESNKPLSLSEVVEALKNDEEKLPMTPRLKDYLRNMLLGKTAAPPAYDEVTVTPTVPTKSVGFAPGS